MPAHILVMDRSNYDICMRRGVAGIPSAKEGSSSKDSINNALISRLCIVKENDYILFTLLENTLFMVFGRWRVPPFLTNLPSGQLIRCTHNYILTVYVLKTCLIIMMFL